MNFFSSDEYLLPFAETFFPGRAHRIGPWRAQGKVFRLVDVDGHGPVTSWEFLDFFQPVEDDPAKAAGTVRWLPRVALETRDVVAALPDDAPAPTDFTFQPAPYVDWSRFSGWEAFQDHFATRRSSLLRDSKQKRRNLEKAFGPVRFEWDDRRGEVFDQALAWKSAQYVRSNLPDLFARPGNAALFRRLWAQGTLIVSSLSAGERLLAVHFGAQWRRRFFSWVAAYDPEHFRYSPGRLLLEGMLRESQGLGHAEFDFLIGSESYKYHYATHERVIGPLGSAPLRQRLRKAARGAVRRALGLYPPLLERLRALENRRAAPPPPGRSGGAGTPAA
jgi:hypothetical protein